MSLRRSPFAIRQEPDVPLGLVRDTALCPLRERDLRLSDDARITRMGD
jgi:hypothetical protein